LGIRGDPAENLIWRSRVSFDLSGWRRFAPDPLNPPYEFLAPVPFRSSTGLRACVPNPPLGASNATDPAQSVAYIDLTSITTTWYNPLGSNGWQQYHALGTDKTHTNAAGAIRISRFVTSAITTQNIGLSKYLRP